LRADAPLAVSLRRCGLFQGPCAIGSRLALKPSDGLPLLRVRGELDLSLPAGGTFRRPYKRRETLRDAALGRLLDFTRESMRAQDTLARYGGEES